MKIPSVALTTMACVLAALSSGAASATIYRWVDDDGRVHFGDRPQAEDAEAIEVKPVEPATKGARQRHERTQRVLEAFTAERKEREGARLARRDEAAERKRKCSAARAEQQRRETSGHLYHKDENGNKRIIEGAEYDAAIKQARDAVTHWCS